MSCREPDVRSVLCQSSGESLLRIGKLANFLVRHGLDTTQVARELGVGDKVCVLAIAFLTAPDCLKFRALVEDWNLLVIRSQLRVLSTSASC